MTKQKDRAEKAIRDSRRVTRRQYSAEEKIRIVLEGLRGESSIAELCRKEALAETVLENRLLKKSMFGAGGDDT